MSTPPKFRFFLKADATTYYYKDSAGLIQTIANPLNTAAYALQSEPGNWDKIELKWGRNEIYWGLFRSVSSSIDFNSDAADICRKVYYTQGIEGVLIFEIWLRDDTTWNYSLLYTGNVDFSGAVDGLTDFTAPIAESGVLALIKANDNTPYEIPINDAGGAIQVYMDGPTLQADYSYASIATVENGVIANQFFPVPIVSVAKDGDYTVGEQHDQQLMLMGNGAPAWATNSAQHNNYCYRVDENFTAPVTVYLKLDHEIMYTADGGNGSPVSLRVHAVVADSTVGTVSQDIVIYTDPGAPLNAGQSRHMVIPTGTLSAAITMQPNERLYYLFQLVPITPISGTPKANFVFFGEQKVEVLIDFRLAPSVTKAYRYYQVADKLTAAFTAGAYTSHSDFLYDPGGLVNVVDSRPYQVAVTSGDAVRRLNTNSTGAQADPVLRITLRDFFKDMNGRWLLGLGVDSSGVMIIKPLSAFFDTSQYIGDLGEVTNLRIEPYKEIMFNQFKAGFPKQDSNKLNGKDAFNTTSVWKMPMTKLPAKEQDFTSSFIGDMYPIEELRANLSDKKTTDSSNDNGTVLLDIATTTFSGTVGGQAVTGAFLLRRPNNSGNTSGIISPDYAYNLSLSPARAKKRLGPLLHSIAHLLDAKYITFQASDKNQYLISDLGSGSITENADTLISALGSILLKPVKFTFDAISPYNLGDLVANKPYGWFSASWYGKAIKGFIGDAGIKAAKPEAQQWSLISTPDCDLTQFYPH